jgi:UDP:flavonoid glycosyltransferase YjiC (YdhE family)
MKKIRYYISGHGLGHASRSCQIINTLLRRRPDIGIEVVTAAHSWFLERYLDPSVPVRRRSLDLGVLQRDSLVMMERETLLAYRQFLPERQRIVREEAESLLREEVSLVAADIPPCAFAAASLAGIPSVGIGNFSWDWIYEDMAARFSGFDDVLESVRRDYVLADRLLRLPFHGEFPAFRHIEDIPMVTRRAVRSPVEVRRLLEIAPGKKLGLISFGGFGLGELRSENLGRIPEWLFLTEPALAEGSGSLLAIPEESLSYPDLVGAADAVITKPGYGIVSECIANRTPVLFTSRGDFREQSLLVDALQRFSRALEIDNESLRSGKWEDHLRHLLTLPEPVEKIVANGEIAAAGRLAELA